MYLVRNLPGASNFAQVREGDVELSECSDKQFCFTPSDNECHTDTEEESSNTDVSEDVVSSFLEDVAPQSLQRGNASFF